MNCPKCQTPIPQGASFCPSCGTHIPTEKRCPKCHSVIAASSTFCPNCGLQLGGRPASAPQPTPPQPTPPRQTSPAPQQNSAPAPQKSSWGSRFLKVFILLFVILLFRWIGSSIGKNIASDYKKSTPVVSNPVVFNEAPKTKLPQGDDPVLITPEPAQSPYTVKILAARVVQDYKDKPAVLIKYSFQNNGSENKSFSLAIRDKVFQNGVELSSTVISQEYDPPFDSSAKIKEVQPGGNIILEAAYALSDSTSNVDVEVSERFAFNGGTLDQMSFVLP